MKSPRVPRARADRRSPAVGESAARDVSTDTPAESLTHVDSSGKAVMVDVSAKAETIRRAVARGCVRMKPETAALINAGQVAKGSVLTVARVAGVMAAKKCPELVPLAHPLLLTDIQVELEVGDGRVEIEAVVTAAWKTGVEMEALTAVTIAALTVYDMCKAVDRTMVIEAIRVVHKSGGKTRLDTDPLE